jgi:hypothetical protein
LKFPQRIYTTEEVKTAKKLIDEGYKHRLRTKGNQNFNQKVKQALQLVKTADTTSFSEHTSVALQKSTV